jgi:hypothetical protein
MALQQGDEIHVVGPAIVTLRFPEGHLVFLQPDTSVRIGSIFQSFGTLIVRARGLFRLQTDYWTAGVEGTEFSVSLSPDKKGEVAVTEGSISLSSNTGGWREIRVAENEVATILRDAPPSKALMRKAQLNAVRDLIRRLPRPPLRPPLRLPR